LSKHGGHAMAAGFSVPVERIGELTERLDEVVRRRLAGVRPVPSLRVDAEIAAEALTSRLALELATLEPCGAGNPRPYLLVRDVRVYDIRQVGPDGDTELVKRAHAYAAEAHGTQRRVSGEPYITHPAAVAMLVAELGMDSATVAAALLHDVPEDTERTTEDVRRDFGEEIGRLVDGVTKLSRLSGQ